NFLADCKLSALNRLHVPQKVYEELRRLSTGCLTQIWGEPVGPWRRLDTPTRPPNGAGQAIAPRLPN
ncbi:MAG: hypothetical protein ACK4WF_09040, partial [Candidatus Brocadiales bacterium]